MAAAKHCNTLVLLLLCSTAALSLADALTCLTVEPSSNSGSSDNPLLNIQTVNSQTADSGGVCATYFARCASVGSLCNAEEVEAGDWKWVYGSLSSAQCESLTANYGSYKYVTCCATNNCNVPDPALDPDTTVDPSVQLQPRAGGPVASLAEHSMAARASKADVLVNASSSTNSSSVGLNNSHMRTAAIIGNGAFQKPPSLSHKKGAAGNQQHKNGAGDQQHKNGGARNGNAHHTGGGNNKQQQQHRQQPQNSNKNKQHPPAQQQKQQQQQQKKQQQQQQQHKPKHLAHGSAVPTMKCYRNVARARDLAPAVAPKAFRKVDGVDMCTRYQFRCTAGDKTCTAAEKLDRVWKWAYMPISSSTCIELKTYANKQDAVIRHVLCCSGTNCNRPNPLLDRETKVISNTVAEQFWTAPAKQGSSRAATKPNHGPARSHHQESAPAPAAAAAVDAPLSAEPAAPQSAAAAAAADVQPSTVQQIEPKAVVRSSRISCYTSNTRTADVQPSVMPRLYHKSGDGVDVCARYQLKCSEDRKVVCTAAEAEAGAWIWQYKPLSSSVCNEMKAIAAVGADSGYRNVVCCSSNACNRPDAAADPSTKIVRP